VKVAFDENMPAALVRTFQTLAADKGFKRLFRNVVIVTAKDYTPEPSDSDYMRKSDVPWLRRYRRDGGKIVVSGNTRMVRVPQELQALIEEGLVTFFFPEVWNRWRFPRKCGLIMVWLERLISEGRRAARGSLYRIPDMWTPDAHLLVIRPPTPLKLGEVEQPERRRRTAPRRIRSARSPDPDGPDLLSLIQSSASQPTPGADRQHQSQTESEAPQSQEPEPVQTGPRH